MTREAKIGMLTGLMVIVLIGVLLSDYLGGPGRGGAMSPTGRMAELPMGAAYRQEVTEPVGVPGMARGDGAAGTTVPVSVVGGAGSPTMPEPKAGSNGTGVTPSVPVGGGPIVGQPVTPVPAGQVRMDQPLGDGPTLQLADGTSGAGTEVAYTAGQAMPGTPGALTFTDVVASPAVKGQEYVIAPGDTLGKIATKFYKTSKGDAVQRIVAANPKVLKDSKTMLIAGKKLIIPTVPAAPKIASATGAVAVVPAKKTPAVVIHAPGGATPAAAPPVAADAPKKAVPSAYVVQAGDTLEKIAKRVSPTAVTATVKKIEALNGISDPTALQVGQKLKLPAA